VKNETIDESGAEVLDPRKALSEQTLAVDLERIQIDQQIATAHKFPRVLDTVMKKIATMACYNKEVAESCIYALPRGGKPIIGPSIGFANIVAQSWGNCRVGARIVYIDTRQKVVIAEGAFLDLESNTQSLVPVQRRIVDSKGRLYSEDMQIVTGMAAASIARRNAILQGVSRGLWNPIWNDALGIVRGNVQTFAENKAAAFKALAQFGVTPVQVVMVLGLKGEVDLTFEHVPMLRGMYQSLRDGSTTVEELLDPRRMTGKGFETVDNPLGDHAEAEAEEDATAGMGEPAAQSDAVAGKADAGAAEARGAPAAEGAVKAQPAQASAQAAAAGARPKLQPAADPEPEPKKAEPPKATEPTTPAEYLAAWKEFCAGATSESQIKNQRAKDRNLRAAVGKWTPEQMDELDSIQNDRVVELRR
jgi:hypothetical protein